MPVGGAPLDDGVMCCSDLAERSAVDSHRGGPGRQRGCGDPTGEGARLVEHDADLDVGHAVQVEHDVAASPVNPAGVQTVPHLAEKLPPQCGEVLPRRRGGYDGGGTGLDRGDPYL